MTQSTPELKTDAKTSNPTALERWSSHYLSNRRQVGTVVAVVVALFLAWHVVTGRNGLNSWQQKRSENKSLASEIDQLNADNARLSQHVDRLKSDPGAIEHEARARLGYARPNEVIWSSPAAAQASSSDSRK